MSDGVPCEMCRDGQPCGKRPTTQTEDCGYWFCADCTQIHLEMLARLREGMQRMARGER